MVKHFLVNIRLSWLPALWVRGKGERAKEDSEVSKSDVNFSVWKLKSLRSTSRGHLQGCWLGRYLIAPRIPGEDLVGSRAQ